jgi:uncharacterized membrane protein YqgA involved in biofilm formation
MTVCAHTTILGIYTHSDKSRACCCDTFAACVFVYVCGVDGVGVLAAVCVFVCGLLFVFAARFVQYNVDAFLSN